MDLNQQFQETCFEKDSACHRTDSEELHDRYELLEQQYNILWRKYQKLANSKAGRFMLWYWKKKDVFSKLRKSFSRFWRKRKSIQDQSQLPSVTVIIPTYKHNPFLDDAVQSILNQDYPSDKVVILIAVNGASEEYAQNLQRQYGSNQQIKILYTKIQSVGAARNMALSAVKTECVCYLDDDDMLSEGYLTMLGSHMRRNTTIVCGPLCDYSAEKQGVSEQTYINQTIEDLGEGEYRRSLLLASLFSSLPAKLYRSQLLQNEFKPLDETIRNSEDIIFWAENYHAIRDRIYLCDLSHGEYYIRRLTPGSLSRPLREDRFQFYVTDRLSILERLESLFNQASTEEERNFIQSKIMVQREFLCRFGSTLTGEEKKTANELIQRSTVEEKDALFLL